MPRWTVEKIQTIVGNDTTFEVDDLLNFFNYLDKIAHELAEDHDCFYDALGEVEAVFPEPICTLIIEYISGYGHEYFRIGEDEVYVKRQDEMRNMLRKKKFSFCSPLRHELNVIP